MLKGLSAPVLALLLVTMTGCQYEQMMRMRRDGMLPRTKRNTDIIVSVNGRLVPRGIWLAFVVTASVALCALALCIAHALVGAFRDQDYPAKKVMRE